MTLSSSPLRLETTNEHASVFKKQIASSAFLSAFARTALISSDEVPGSLAS